MSSPISDSPQAKLAEIEASIRAGDLAGAEALLSRVRVAFPLDVRICLIDAAIARAGHDAEREIGALQQAARLTPGWPVAHVELSKALARHDRLGEAVDCAAKAVELAPDDLGVLQVAVAVANQAGSYKLAERHLRTANALQPENLSILRSLALCLFVLKRFAEAESLYRRVLSGDPDNPIALDNLGECLVELGRNEEAAECFERALELLPDNTTLKFHLMLARGESPATQATDITRALFDQYAVRFDGHLAGTLKYRVPKRVAEIVRARHADLNVDVLDLGCGTGLTGVYLGGGVRTLVGVDLSAGMLERARRHGIYTRLRQGDLRDELQESAAGSYDCVIANDVFIYVGDISAVIPAVFEVLRNRGILIFSCETAADTEGDFVLRMSKRYAHSRAYVERLCRGAGFVAVDFEEIELRMEGDSSIQGFIVVAEKS